VFRPILLEAHNPGPMTGRGNNTYLIVGDDRTATLVDAGVGDSRHLAALSDSLSAADARLERVVVTHGHADHASGAPAIASAHPAAFAKYPWPDEDARYGVSWSPLADAQTIDIGSERLSVLHTGGHSPDHVVFWHEASRSAFTGDLVVSGGSVMIHWSRGGNLERYLSALERLLALEPRVLLPAHGPAVDDPAALLTQYLEHRRHRERQVIAALESGRSTVQAIAESIYHGLDPALVPAAQENVRAHLEKLRTDGRAREDAGRWRL
jgi:glyoxylase-like metal-dependent hydrolase (beta-lactamase superfamily II)